MTVTVDPELLEAANRAVADGEAESLSGWVGAALADKVARDRKLADLQKAVEAYEAEFGTITPRGDGGPRPDRSGGCGDRARPTSRRASHPVACPRLTPRDGGARQRGAHRPRSGQASDVDPHEGSSRHRRGTGHARWRGRTGVARQPPPSTTVARAQRHRCPTCRRSHDDRMGRAAGALLGVAGTSDVIDAAVVLLASDGDDIITSDADDMTRLASTMDLHIEILHP